MEHFCLRAIVCSWKTEYFCLSVETPDKLWWWWKTWKTDGSFLWVSCQMKSSPRQGSPYDLDNYYENYRYTCDGAAVTFVCGCYPKRIYATLILCHP